MFWNIIFSIAVVMQVNVVSLSTHSIFQVRYIKYWKEIEYQLKVLILYFTLSNQRIYIYNNFITNKAPFKSYPFPSCNHNWENVQNFVFDRISDWCVWYAGNLQFAKFNAYTYFIYNHFSVTLNTNKAAKTQFPTYKCWTL